MKQFDLFGYLGQADDNEATTYQCGYYVINKNTNKKEFTEANDSFYTFLDNNLLKFELMQDYETQYFNVYVLKTFADHDWWKIDSLLFRRDDIDEELISKLLDLENHDPFSLAKIDNDLMEEIEKIQCTLR